jgi:hypothetical protein
MTLTDPDALLSALLSLSEALECTAADAPRMGICGEVQARDSGRADIAREDFLEIARGWPESSGDVDFPVEGCVKLYEKQSRSRALWKKGTVFGDRRRRLLEYSIAKTWAHLRDIDDRAGRGEVAPRRPPPF